MLRVCVQYCTSSYIRVQCVSCRHLVCKRRCTVLAIVWLCTLYIQLCLCFAFSLMFNIFSLHYCITDNNLLDNLTSTVSRLNDLVFSVYNRVR